MSETAQRAGHIPGAASIPWAQTVKEDGTFKSAEDLATLYEAKGVTPDKDVIAYCRIGERSSHSWFVLHELLGYNRVRNYDGSWTEYGSMIGVPIEKPAPVPVGLNPGRARTHVAAGLTTGPPRYASSNTGLDGDNGRRRPRIVHLPDASAVVEPYLQVVTSLDDRRSSPMNATALLFLTIEERRQLAQLEAREREHRLIMATAKREAREARRLARAQAAPPGSPAHADRLAFLRRLVEPAPPCPDARDRIGHPDRRSRPVGLPCTTVGL